MIDLKSVAVSGCIRFSRARALFHEGKVKMYTKEGLAWEADSQTPIVDSSGFRLSRRWIAQTACGTLLLKSKCPTCGGWRRVTRMDPKILWLME